MLKLCYKDYLASRWLWLSAVILYFLYIVEPMGQSVMVMVFGAMYIFGSLAITLIWEEQNRTEALYASLPLTRRQIVSGRYLLVGFIVLAGAAVIFGTVVLGLALLRAPAYQSALGPLLSAEAGVGYFFTAVVLLTGFLPLYYRLGLAKGGLVFLVGYSPSYCAQWEQRGWLQGSTRLSPRCSRRIFSRIPAEDCSV